MFDNLTINLDSPTVSQPGLGVTIDPLLESLVVIAFFSLLPDF